ncbi:LysR family transcriptional regulator [Vallitalea okinawensis]|uniref:LysR family transcriptional regulator n=1 Tax=Vallitalea okinawensis TaxID=2078660 RepID=UPI000CFD5D0A|nr:LysR family transcriptional regulator [Vallitalea okinawensis]
MSMEMELYRIFYIVATHKNISRAAEALFISQPALSKSIKKLEEKMGCKLFIRSSRGVVLTKEGEILFNHVENAMSELLKGENIIHKLINNEKGLIRIGVSNALCKYFLIPHLRSFHEEFPDIKILVINKTTNDTLEMLDNGEIDFGIVSFPFMHSGYEYTELMKIHDIFVTKKVYYNELDQVVSIYNLSRYPIMLLEPDNITRQYLDKYFLDNKIEIEAEIEIGNMEFLIEFAKIGLGISAVIREFVKDDLEEGILKEIPVNPAPVSRSIGIVTHKNIPVSIASQSFISYLINKSNMRN